MDLLAALFDGWEGIIKICIAAPIMYLAVVAAIRVAGKRSTSQMNNFDWIVTVAVGSLTASGIILDSVTVAEALTAIALLLGAQYLLTKGFLASGRLTKLARARPTLLVHNGQFIHEALQRERVMTSEVMAALRENGLVNIQEAQWVILETDATFSVIPKSDRDFSKAQFENISGFPPGNR
ncbi:MAG: YetF domain-containing protein [Cyanobacteria bacterium P01_G01_bin.38]